MEPSRDQLEIQKKRDEFLDESKKRKREDILAKKRNLTAHDENSKLLEEWRTKDYKMDDLPELLNAINSSDNLQQQFGVIGIRRLLSQDAYVEPCIEKIIDADVILLLIDFTERNQDPQLQHEAARALANIANGTSDQIQSFVDQGALQVFLELLEHENPEIYEQAIWGLGNIAVQNTGFRNQILKMNALRPMMDIIEKAENIQVVKTATWALSNFVRGKPLPKFELVRETIPIFSKIIQQTQDLETLVDALLAFSDLFELNKKQNEKIRFVFDTNIYQSLVAQLKSNQNLTVLGTLLKILGNFLSGTDEQTSEVLKVPGVVERLVELATTHHARIVVRESCWCLSNITAGNPEQIQMVLKDPDQIKNLMKLHNHTESEIGREALYIFLNATERASETKMTILCDCNLIELFCGYLNIRGDSQKTIIALDGIANVLDKGASIAQKNNTDNMFRVRFEEKGGLELLTDLQTHPSAEIYQKAIKILDKHYEMEEV